MNKNSELGDMQLKAWKKIPLVVVPAFIVVGLGIYGHRIYESHLYDSLHEEMIYQPVDSEQISELSIDFSLLQETNTDIQAWIDIPGTSISYPVLQSSPKEDEDYYLHHNLDRTYGYPGVIYMQKINAADFSDPVTVLYGHNMRDGSMFAGLHDYAKGKFFDDHPDIYVYTPTGTKHYQVFASVLYDDRLILDAYQGFQSAEAMNLFLDETMKQADQANYAAPVGSDAKLLVLSTCDEKSSDRYLVEAVLLENE